MFVSRCDRASGGSKLNNLDMKIIKSIIIIVLLNSCINSHDKDSNINDKYYSDSAKLSTLIAATIDLPEFQQYYTAQKNQNLNQLVIVDNRDLKGIEKLNKFGNHIILMKEKEITDKKIIFFIRFDEITLKKDSAFVDCYYAGKNIELISSYFFENGKWKIIKYQIWEL